MKVKDSLITVSNTEPKRKIPFITLTNILEWTKKNPENIRKMTGEKWLGLFFNDLTSNQSRPKS
jgi:hypothetical protein